MMTDQQNATSAPGFHLPDAVWAATNNGSTSVTGFAAPADGFWANHQRINQYNLGSTESYSGQQLTIDADAIDAPVVAANTSPTALFTSSVRNLTASFDGSPSTDADGTVASYSWDFGDGTAPGTAAKPSHVYPAAGSYQVTLTVTDNLGATASVTHTVVVTAAPAAPGPGGVVSLAPSRILDTRTRQVASGPVPTGASITVPVAGQGGVPSSGVSAVVMNVTVANPSASGFVTAWPTGTDRPNTSNLNFQAGQNIPNLVLVPLGPDGKIQLYNGSPGTVQLIADVAGYIIGS